MPTPTDPTTLEEHGTPVLASTLAFFKFAASQLICSAQSLARFEVGG